MPGAQGKKHGETLAEKGKPYNLFLSYQPPVQTYASGFKVRGYAGASAAIRKGEPLVKTMEVRLEAEIRFLADSAEVLACAQIREYNIAVVYRQDDVLWMKVVSFNPKTGWNIGRVTKILDSWEGAKDVTGVTICPSDEAPIDGQKSACSYFYITYRLNGAAYLQKWHCNDRRGLVGMDPVEFSRDEPVNIAQARLSSGLNIVLYQKPKEDYEAYISIIDMEQGHVLQELPLSDFVVTRRKTVFSPDGAPCSIPPYQRDEVFTQYWTLIPVSDFDVFLCYQAETDDGSDLAAALRLSFGGPALKDYGRLRRKMSCVVLDSPHPFISRLSACGVSESIYGADIAMAGVQESDEGDYLALSICKSDGRQTAERRLPLEQYRLAWRSGALPDNAVSTRLACIKSAMAAAVITDESIYIAAYHFRLQNSKCAMFKYVGDYAGFVAVLPFAQNMFAILWQDSAGAAWLTRAVPDDLVYIPSPVGVDIPDGIAMSDCEPGQELSVVVHPDEPMKIEYIPYDEDMTEERDYQAGLLVNERLRNRQAFDQPEWTNMDEDARAALEHEGKLDPPQTVSKARGQ